MVNFRFHVGLYWGFNRVLILWLIDFLAFFSLLYSDLFCLAKWQ